MPLTATPRLTTAILAELQASLPALVSAAGQTAIASWLRYMPALANPREAPQVWVSMARIRPGGPAAFGGSNAHQTWVRTVLIGATASTATSQTASDSDAAAAADALGVYADCIFRVIEGAQNTGGETYRAVCTDVQFSPNMGDDELFFGEVVLTFELSRWTGLGQD